MANNIFFQIFLYLGISYLTQFSQKYLINDVSQQISTNIKRNNNGEEKKIKYTLKYYENYQNNKNK